MAGRGMLARRKAPVTTTLDAATIARLDRCARETGLSRSGYIRRLVESAVEENEIDQALVAEAERRLDDPGDEVISLERGLEEIGL